MIWVYEVKTCVITHFITEEQVPLVLQGYLILATSDGWLCNLVIFYVLYSVQKISDVFITNDLVGKEHLWCFNDFQLTFIADVFNQQSTLGAKPKYILSEEVSI